MQSPGARIRTAEKLAGVVAIVAALVVLNGAWVNQHSFQNVSWRVAVAGLLAVLAIVVETNALGLLRSRERGDDTAVPEFLRTGVAAQVGKTHTSLEAESEFVNVGTPSLPK